MTAQIVAHDPTVTVKPAQLEMQAAVYADGDSRVLAGVRELHPGTLWDRASRKDTT